MCQNVCTRAHVFDNKNDVCYAIVFRKCLPDVFNSTAQYSLASKSYKYSCERLQQPPNCSTDIEGRKDAALTVLLVSNVAATKFAKAALNLVSMEFMQRSPNVLSPPCARGSRWLVVNLPLHRLSCRDFVLQLLYRKRPVDLHRGSQVLKLQANGHIHCGQLVRQVAATASEIQLNAS